MDYKDEYTTISQLLPISSEIIYFKDLNNLYIADVPKDGNCFFTSFLRIYNIFSKICGNNFKFKDSQNMREYIYEYIHNIKNMFYNNKNEFNELKENLIKNGCYNFEFLPIIYLLSINLNINIRILFPNEKEKYFNCQIFNDNKNNLFKIDLLLYQNHYQNIIDDNQYDIICSYFNHKININISTDYCNGYNYMKITNLDDIYNNILSDEEKSLELELSKKFKNKQLEIFNSIKIENDIKNQIKDSINIFNDISISSLHFEYSEQEKNKQIENDRKLAQEIEQNDKNDEIVYRMFDKIII